MKSLRLTTLSTLALLATGFMMAAVAGDPPPWAPAHGWRAKHHYVYYPSAEVYYSPESRLWFWFGGTGWQVGADLPLELHGYVRTGGINVGLDVDRPYLRNRYVVQRYGGHRRAYWRHDSDHRYGDDDRNWHGDQGHRGQNGNHGHRNDRGHGKGHRHH